MHLNISLPAVAMAISLVSSWFSGYVCEVHILLQTLTGSVPSGNYSYYKLSRSGNIRFHLRTHEGDADVYLSESTLHPTYNDYDMKSATFGEEILDIPQTMARPVGIGVYGYPLYLNDTVYEFDILLDTTEYIDPWNVDANEDLSKEKFFNAMEEPEKESILWNLLIGILKVAVDVMI